VRIILATPERRYRLRPYPSRTMQQKGDGHKNQSRITGLGLTLQWEVSRWELRCSTISSSTGPALQMPWDSADPHAPCATELPNGGAMQRRDHRPFSFVAHSQIKILVTGQPNILPPYRSPLALCLFDPENGRIPPHLLRTSRPPPNRRLARRAPMRSREFIGPRHSR